MRVSDELSYDEIAQQTGTPINTVSTRIFKARALLAELFGAPRKKPPARGNNEGMCTEPGIYEVGCLLEIPGCNGRGTGSP